MNLPTYGIQMGDDDETNDSEAVKPRRRRVSTTKRTQTLESVMVQIKAGEKETEKRELTLQAMEDIVDAVESMEPVTDCEAFCRREFLEITDKAVLLLKCLLADQKKRRRP
jgi:hypothetical protein